MTYCFHGCVSHLCRKCVEQERDEARLLLILLWREIADPESLPWPLWQRLSRAVARWEGRATTAAPDPGTEGC